MRPGLYTVLILLFVILLGSASDSSAHSTPGGAEQLCAQGRASLDYSAFTRLGFRVHFQGHPAGRWITGREAHNALTIVPAAQRELSSVGAVRTHMMLTAAVTGVLDVLFFTLEDGHVGIAQKIYAGVLLLAVSFAFAASAIVYYTTRALDAYNNAVEQACR